MPSTTLCIDQLCLSPLNVRLNEADATATTALEASILADGLLQPLSAHPLPDGLYGVFAGGRRYRSIRNLVDRGDLATDWPVAVVIHEDATEVELVARSLDENMLRRDLRPYEMYAAVQRESELGHSADQIARRHGQELSWVRQALRLGSLARPVFDAFAGGQISLEQAQAYGATADHAVQEAAFEAMQARPDAGRTPAAIRGWLGVNDAEAARLMRFVGIEAYRDAGGAWEPDLFNDGADDRGRVTDDALLRRLADARIAALKDRTREVTGRPDLRFVGQAPASSYGGPDYVLSITPQQRGTIEDGAIAIERQILPDGDIVAVVGIPESGEADVSFWWASRKAYNAATRAAEPGAPPPKPLRPATPAGRVSPGAAIGQQYDDSRQRADALIREEQGLTKDSIEVLRSIRRSILRAALIRDARDGGVLARDYLVWAQLRMLLPRDGDPFSTARQNGVGMRGISSPEADGDVARGLIGATEAGKAWGKAIADLQRESFLTDTNLAGAFLDFRAASPATRDLAAAVVAGLAMERSLAADGYDVPVHDAVAVAGRLSLPANIRRWWQPSAGFLGLIPRAEQLAVAEPMMESAVFGTWQRLRVDELLPLVLKLVTGKAANVRRSMAAAAADWVHPLLAFRTDGGWTAAAQREDAA